MRIEEQIKMLCAKTNLSSSEIARRLNRSPQAFRQKLKRGTITIEDLQNIAMVAGCRFECAFLFPDGERIDIK